MAQPAQAAAHIVVDDSEHEVEAFDDDFSETSSIASSIYQFRIEHGRRYHAYKAGAYWGPNDEIAQEVLDLAHHAYLLAMGQKLYLAPLSKPQKVLDVGTGTGIWAIDFADQHPEALVIGTDLSPTQPGWVPQNVKFQVDDATDYPWTFGTNTFDYIHVRDLFGSIPDWTAFMKQCLTCLKPGGYLEVSNASVWLESDDGSIPADAKHPLRQWGRLFRECGEIMGKTTSISENQRDVMIDAGFEAVEETRFKLVVGPWPKDPVLKQLGRYRQIECLQGCEGWALALLTRVLKWDVEEVQVLLANFRACVKDRNIHSYTPVSVVVGRKPLGDGQGV
ncbi:SAM dependent methyltransferase [Histoplasma ohiense]|nr:SAM dependent methyltransferase [Histoplasma ohiense (nom. inval.)]